MMKELEQEMAELAENAQQCLYDERVFTRAQVTQAVARLADVVSKLCSFVEEPQVKAKAESDLDYGYRPIQHLLSPVGNF